MTRADVQAATPKCNYIAGSALSGVVCGAPLSWASARHDPTDGTWSCAKHGKRFDGLDVARRAGFAGMWFEAVA